MKNQKIIFWIWYLCRYFLHDPKFWVTVIKFLYKKCVNRINRIKPKQYLNASTYNIDKEKPLKQKAVECNKCIYYDYYNGICNKDDECNAGQI